MSRAVFGVKGDVNSSVFHIDDTTIVYAAGNYVVIMNVETKQQHLIPCSLESACITAMSMSRSRKYLAVAEQADKATISIIDLSTRKRRSKALVTSEAQSNKYVSLAWSPDEEWLIAQGAEPEWKLVLWRWPSGLRSQVAFSDKVQANNQGEAFQCLFHPTNGETVTVIGSGVNKVLKLVVENREGVLRSVGFGMGKIGDGSGKGLVTHCWLPGQGSSEADRMLIGTEQGEIYIQDPEHGWETIKAMQVPEGVSVASICSYANSKAFTVGGTGGSVMFFVAQDLERDPYKLLRTIQIKGETGTVKSISISPSQENMVVTTSTNQIYMMELSSADMQSNVVDNNAMKSLLGTPHCGEVTGMDVCLRKPLLATCSSTLDDYAVKLWNYRDETCDLSVKFAEMPLSVSIHPTGHLLVVGFADKVRLCNILMDDYKEVRTFPIKGCREVRFCVGGQYFVAVDPLTHAIKVYATYTGEEVAELARHTNKVWSLQWSRDDANLISCGSDGQVICWCMRTFKVLFLHQTRGQYFTSAVPAPSGRTLLACGSDKGLKEIGEDGAVLRHVGCEEEFSQLAVVHGGQAILAATENGIIRAFRWPIKAIGLEQIQPPLKAHALDYNLQTFCVSRMCMVAGAAMAYTAGHDGSISMYKLGAEAVPVGAAAKAAEKGKADALVPPTDEVLVTKTDLEQRKAAMEELVQRVSDNQAKYQWEISLLNKRLREQISNLTAKFNDELDKDRKNYAKLLSDKKEMKAMYDEKLRTAEAQHAQELDALESSYREKIQQESQRYHELEQEMEMMRERYMEQDTLLHENHARNLRELESEYNRQLREEQEQGDMLENQRQEMARKFEEKRAVVEDDADSEVETLTNMYKNLLAKEREDGASLSLKNTSMAQTKEQLDKEVNKLKTDIKRLFETEKLKYADIASHEKDRETLKKEMKERDETIAEKEKRIYDLKRKNQELEKFKWMLDYKIKDLRAMIEPREAEIATMREQVKEMDNELERYEKQNAALELTASELQLRISALQDEESKQDQDLEDIQNLTDRYRRELHYAVLKMRDEKQFKEAIKELYKRFAELDVDELVAGNEVASEHSRQRDHLEKTVETLKRKLATDVERSRASRTRVVAEHVALVQEINELRRELKLVLTRGQNMTPSAAGRPKASPMPPGSGAGGGPSDADLEREVAMQELALRKLEDEVRAREEMLLEIRAGAGARPPSGRLPPLERGPQPVVEVPAGAGGPEEMGTEAMTADAMPEGVDVVVE